MAKVNGKITKALNALQDDLKKHRATLDELANQVNDDDRLDSLMEDLFCENHKLQCRVKRVLRELGRR